MCICTEQLKFLDIINYIAPGFTYDSFLKAYGADVSKSFWPYVWFDSLEKLQQRTFPTYEDFYSPLKQRNTLEPQPTESLDQHETELIRREPTKKAPLTTVEVQQISQNRYEELQSMFYVNKWSMKDLLEHYNNLDTAPFLTALENLTKYYIDRNVDIFKDAVSGKDYNIKVVYI